MVDFTRCFEMPKILHTSEFQNARDPNMEPKWIAGFVRHVYAEHCETLAWSADIDSPALNKIRVLTSYDP